MTRADAQKAVDDAFADGLKRLFEVLVTNLETTEAAVAMKRFTAGLAFHDEAHAKASLAIEQIFPE